MDNIFKCDYSAKDKSICAHHINDKSIRYFIQKNYSDGHCDYCDKDNKVIPFEDLIEFMFEGICNFYEDPADFMSYDGRQGGYLGYTFDTNELIQDNIGLDTDPFELTEDIIEAIDNKTSLWSDPDMYYDTERDELMYQWSYFKKIVKHKTRYLFQQNQPSEQKQNAYSILKAVGLLTKKLKLVKKIDEGTILYRCRQHETSMQISEIDEIVAPPNNLAIYPNRFSPSGISMLYSALDKDTAILETISREDKAKKYYTFAEFKLKRDVYIIDYVNLPNTPSIFNLKTVKDRYLNMFLKDLVDDFTKEVKKDGCEHTEYVPTQVVTEYFRYPFNKRRTHKIEGIIYPSAQNKGGKSVVLFWDQHECKQNLDLVSLDRGKVKEYLNDGNLPSKNKS